MHLCHRNDAVKLDEYALVQLVEFFHYIAVVMLSSKRGITHL